MLAGLLLTAGCADLPVPGRATGTVRPALAAQPTSKPAQTPSTKELAPGEGMFAGALTPSPDPSPTNVPPTPVPPSATARPTNTPDPTATSTPKPTATVTPTVTPTAQRVPQRVGELIVRGDPKTGVVALTCDAGGTIAGGTASVLDTFKSYKTSSTFFLTGEWAQANPALVRRMAAEGHELANHTVNHPDLTTISDQAIRDQLLKAEQIVQGIVGYAPVRMVRPPFGAYDQRVLRAAGSVGFEIIFWSLDSGDWLPDTSVAQVAATVGTRAQAGDIVVMHCYSDKTAQALPAAMKQLAARGLKFGTVSDVLGGPKPAPSPTAEPTKPAATQSAKPVSTPTAVPPTGTRTGRGQ